MTVRFVRETFNKAAESDYYISRYPELLDANALGANVQNTAQILSNNLALLS